MLNLAHLLVFIENRIPIRHQKIVNESAEWLGLKSRIYNFVFLINLILPKTN